MTDNYPQSTALPSVVLPSYVLTARSLAQNYSNQQLTQATSDANTLLQFTESHSRGLNYNALHGSHQSSTLAPLNRPPSNGSNPFLPLTSGLTPSFPHQATAPTLPLNRPQLHTSPNLPLNRPQIHSMIVTGGYYGNAPRSEYQLNESDDPNDEAYEEMLRNKWSCNSIRMKVKKFLAMKTMTQTALLKQIGVNSNSFGRFMKLKGPYGGCDNSSYSGLLHFFYQLEKKEKKEKEEAKMAKKAAPKRKVKDTGSDSDDQPIAPKKAKSQSKENQSNENQPPVKKGPERLAEIEAIQLPPDLLVYDDCDVVRDHIIVYLARKECTQVALAENFQCSVASIRKFLAMKGVREGSGSIVYKAAYSFFEKLRILEVKPKTAKRLRIEKTKPEGYELVRDPTRGWIYVGP
ncbi:hypothetical protein THRCLA_04048 [Thraustotheca clavata]|uniref:DUF7726 domain-containing protein n=1 Tax=Thraustotheca clavata TaxID=74557 RepID=A0A1W0A048_9STRA|nr:hypothetical protein THRCLA_04048 [Thraustotheca clavata]